MLVAAKLGGIDASGGYLSGLFSGLLFRPWGDFSGGLCGMWSVDVHLGGFGCLWNFVQTFEEVSKYIKSFTRLNELP